MARIAGIDLPRNKRGIISLQYIYGIGATRAKNILEQASISEQVKVQDWTDDNVMNISRIVQEQFKVEGELRFVVSGLKPMPAPVKESARQLPTRRK